MSKKRRNAAKKQDPPVDRHIISTQLAELRQQEMKLRESWQAVTGAIRILEGLLGV